MQSDVLIRAFIASPSDVSDEREEACRVIADWNAAHSISRSVLIDPVRVETHSQLAQGAHPQDLINKQLLERCDFLVAIFWSRLGTPTKNDSSGTLQEIREFSEAKGADRVLLFFSSKDLPGDVDTDQLENVRTFKKEIQDKGLYSEFSGTTDFARKFRQQLELVMNALLESQEIEQVRPQRDSSTTPLPTSCTLLVEASQDSHGTVLSSSSNYGRSVRTNGRKFCQAGDPRSEARWKEAIDQLMAENLLEDQGYKQEVLQLTQKGYGLADTLWYVRFLRCIDRLQSDTSDFVELSSLQNKAWMYTLTEDFVQGKLQELSDHNYIKATRETHCLMNVQIQNEGRKLIRDNESIEFAQPDV